MESFLAEHATAKLGVVLDVNMPSTCTMDL
jgi:hypothetical protein